MWNITNRREEETVKYQKILLKIIEEEIDKFLFEQAPPAAPAPPTPPTPPADPSAATPPADPSASGDDSGGGEEGDDDKEEPKDDLEQSIEKLASKTAIDIKKTLLSALQNGAEKEKTQTLVAYVTNKAKEEKQGEEEKEVPENIKKAVKHIVKTFKFNVPEKAQKEAEKKVEEDKSEEEERSEEESASTETPAAAASPPAPTPPAAPVKESRLQTSLREYLMYKQLIKKVKR